MDMNFSATQLVQYTRKRLEVCVGRFQRVADASGVPYFTILKIHQGITPNPRIATIIPLVQVLSHHEKTGDFFKTALPRAARRNTGLLKTPSATVGA